MIHHMTIDYDDAIANLRLPHDDLILREPTFQVESIFPVEISSCTHRELEVTQNGRRDEI